MLSELKELVDNSVEVEIKRDNKAHKIKVREITLEDIPKIFDYFKDVKFSGENMVESIGKSVPSMVKVVALCIDEKPEDVEKKLKKQEILELFNTVVELNGELFLELVPQLQKLMQGATGLVGKTSNGIGQSKS